MLSSAYCYLALPAPQIRAEAPAPRSAQRSSPKRAAADEEAALKWQPLTPMAEQDQPWGCSAGCPPHFLWPHQLCDRGCRAPGLQEWVRSLLRAACR